MVKKQKPKNLGTIEEVKIYIDELYKYQGSELLLSDIQAILERLGATEIGFNKGSIIQYQHHLLFGVAGYTNGLFPIHYVHQGKSTRKVYKINFKRYIYPILKQIIEIEQQKKRHEK